MNYRIRLLIVMSLFVTILSAQESYFQQEVDYKIRVTLDDTKHEIFGNIEIVYTNNSPDDLDVLYFHLWPNAFNKRNSAFGKQAIRQGDASFYFAAAEDRGSITGLAFKVEGQPVAHTLDADHEDIALLKLTRPIQSGQTVSIKTPFRVKVPASYSRLGHVGTSYQMTQWYPKPAVYDKDGWHPMPYLGIGEFYSEFGSFDVEITLPENYVVGATGVLETESEKAFLAQRVEATNQAFATWNEEMELIDTFPSSSPELKTIKYLADQVHDFAWFADKRFYVQKSEVQLNSGKTVDTWAYFTAEEMGLWKEATNYINRAVKHYSDLVGEYPYPHASAVQSALSVGAGMEYPMITVIGYSHTAQALDEVITHEVGHNWFYGILASNERDHAWLDEGLNSYYDHRYSDLYYQDDRFDKSGMGKLFQKESSISFRELGYLYQAKRKEDQAPDTHADEFKSINYWLSAYEKPAISLKWLQRYWGTERFDTYMQGFYETWKFKHPQPEDFQKYMEEASGENLEWFFDGLMNSTKQVDYAVKSITKEKEQLQFTIKNKGEIIAPFPVSFITKDGKTETKFYAGFPGEKSFTISNENYDKIVIDAEKITTDINRKNNTIQTSGVFKKTEPLSFRFLTGVDSPDKNEIYYAPVFGYNMYDGVELGIGLSNITALPKTFEYALFPMYGTKSKKILGLGDLSYNIYPSGGFAKSITLGLSARQFSFYHNATYNYDLQYRKITPSITLKLNSRPNQPFKHYLKFRTIFLTEESANFGRDTIANETFFAGKTTTTNPIFELSYTAKNSRAVNPYELEVALEQQSYDSFRGKQNYWKASLAYTTNYTYKPYKNVSFRFFIGGFLQNSLKDKAVGANSKGSFALYSEGYSDYKYDEFFFGRAENTGLAAQQISLNDGGMKLPLSRSQAANLGHSNQFITSINMKADLPMNLPLGLPLKPYFDIGYFKNTNPLGSEDKIADQIIYSGGVMLDFLDGTIGVYFPILNSKNVKDLFKQQSGGYGNQISFSIDFNKLNPKKLRYEVEL